MKLKNGLELIEPNNNLCDAYFKKAENALQAAVSLQENKEWEIASRYYAMYFGLYALLMKLGVKCENHSCTIEFMKQCLADFFDKEDVRLFKDAMTARIDVQYYTDRIVEQERYKELKKASPQFLVKCKEVRKKINSEVIKKVRKMLEL